MRLSLIGLLTIFFLSFAQAQDKELLLTSGGGVSGIATVYKISRGGNVQKGKGLAEIDFSESGKLKKCTAKKYFKKAKSLMRLYPDFHHPGNLYTSISVVESGVEKKVTWGALEPSVPEDVKKLYQTILTKLERLAFTPQPRK